MPALSTTDRVLGPPPPLHAARAPLLALASLGLLCACGGEVSILDPAPRAGADCQDASPGVLDQYLRRRAVLEVFPEAAAVCRQGDRLWVAAATLEEQRAHFVLVAEAGASLRLHLCRQARQVRIDLMKPPPGREDLLEWDLGPLLRRRASRPVVLAGPAGGDLPIPAAADCAAQVSKSFIPGWRR